MRHEGAYSNHPNDPGGATMWGITEAVARKHGYAGDMRKLPRETAKAIYRESYWSAARADEFHPSIAFQVFDAAVNHGTGNAIRLLQRAVNVIDDGIVGPATLAAVQLADPADVLMRFNAERLDFYTGLGTWQSFGRGWARRVAGNLRYGAADA